MPSSLSFIPFDGVLQNRWRWLAIFLFALECTFRRTLTILLLGVAWLSALIKSMNFFMLTQGQLDTQLLEAQGPRYFTQTILGILELQSLWLAVILTAIGAGLIANDLKKGAYQVYFARPIQAKDYFIGKALAVFFYAFLVIWLPMLVFWVHGFLFSGFHSSQNWQVVSGDITIIRFAQTMAYLFILTVSMGLLILALSAWSKNSKFVGLVFIGIFLVGKFIEQLASFLQLRALSFLSYLKNFETTGRVLFDYWGEGVDPSRIPKDGYMAIVLLGILALFCIVVLYRRLKHIISFGQ